ncbi:hypothetical protein L211DRAFT_870976 [Terfezia boudieri ATCC MYA-4762]|uniref:Uncharacterized protein n=1 Tax=Terfezia boudieri ATCC MYA-4762 TaxID=1051890 RepID=A0A3N4LA84_9PEZI|nr:hypothetical protein L211DRAFT_870976 [Terfezia boudieri ATCC MYA-4762]
MPRSWKDTHPRRFSVSENIEERNADRQCGKSRLLKLQAEKQEISSNERPMSLRGGSRKDDTFFEDRDHPTTQYVETLVDKDGMPLHIPPPISQLTSQQPAPAAGSGAPPTSVPSPPLQNVQSRGAQETRGSNFGSIFNNPTGAGRVPLREHIPPLDIAGPEAMLNPIQPRPNEIDNVGDEFEMAENPGGAHLPNSKALEPTGRDVDDPSVNDQDDEITETPPLEPEENRPLTPPAPTGSKSDGDGASNIQDQGQGDILGNTAWGNGGDTGGNPASGTNPGGNNIQRPTWWDRHKARREARRQFRANATPENNRSTPLSRCCFCTPLCWCAGLVCGPIQWLAHNWCSPVWWRVKCSRCACCS